MFLQFLIASAIILFYLIVIEPNRRSRSRRRAIQRPESQSHEEKSEVPTEVSQEPRPRPTTEEDLHEWARRAYDRLQAHGPPDRPYSTHQMMLIAEVAREREREFFAKSDFGPCPECGCIITSVTVVGHFDALPSGGGTILGTTCSSCGTELRTRWGLNPKEELHWKERE